MPRTHLRPERVIFFPNVWWSHTWERQHELMSLLSEYFGGDFCAVRPLGMLSYSIFSPHSWKKINSLFAHHIKLSSASHPQSTNCPKNLNTQARAIIHPKHLRLVKSVPANFTMNSAILSKIHAMQIMSQTGNPSSALVMCTYFNPVVFEIFSRARWKVIDLAERRKANAELSEAIKDLESRAVEIVT
jgi:hypothetical protein